MFTLIEMIVLGIVSAIFATQNTQTVTLNFNSYTLQTPLYLVVLVAIGVGLVSALFLQIVKNLSDSFAVKRYKNDIKKLKEEVNLLTKENHQLELKNTKMKTELGREDTDEDSM